MTSYFSFCYRDAVSSHNSTLEFRLLTVFKSALTFYDHEIWHN